jgi:EmrB/QacA subfamily drug resistance transporter
MATPSAVRNRLAKQADTYPRIVLATALFGLISATFMVSVLAAVVGTLATEFATSTSTMVWVVVGPNLGFAVLAVSSGKLADMYGRRRAFLVALAGSMIFGGLSALSWSAGSLIAFRTISAIFGSATGPAGIAIIAEQFTGPSRAKVVGWWSMASAAGPVLGIVIGGPVVEQLSWRWIFIGQIPLTALALLAAIYVLPDTAPTRRARFDVHGTALLASATFSLLFASNRGPVWGWTNLVVIILFVAVPVLCVLFVFQERRAPAPLIPLAYFRERNFALPMLIQFFTNVAYMGSGFVLAPLFLITVLGYGPTKAAYLITARPLFFGLAGPVVGLAGAALGERRLSLTGALLIVASAIGLTQYDVDTSDPFIFVTLGVAGLGLGLMTPAMTTAMTNAVHPSDIAMASGAQQMMRQLGTTVGIGVIASIQVASEPQLGLVGSFRRAFIVSAVVAAVGVVGSLGMRNSSVPLISHGKTGSVRKGNQRIAEP